MSAQWLNFKTRPILAATMLLCTLAISGCYEKGCGLDPTEPDPLVGSHEENSASTSLLIVIEYRGGNTDSKSPAQVTVTSFAGAVTVADHGSSALVLPEMTKGARVPFTISSSSGQSAVTCTWGGKVGFIHDAAVEITHFQAGTAPVGACVGW